MREQMWDDSGYDQSNPELEYAIPNAKHAPR
jgi:hypothetical protein